MNPETFQQTLAAHGIKLTEKQMQQFNTYYEYLITINEHVNLTAITDKQEVYLKHFYDSLLPGVQNPELFQQPITLCDVGAGAGFPSIPLKIVFPQLKVTIVDSLNKRITFLHNLVEKLELSDVTLCHDRAETFARAKLPYRESFDLVTARAVARLSVLTELCLPLTKIGGQFLALKASHTEDEVQDADKAIQVLGGKLIKDEQLALPISNDERHLVWIEKIRKTPKKYPRKPGTPNKEPIVSSEKGATKHDK
ncbi:16S rRNA (guanine(527)-N(7))-methyltransferase RsmG [Pediococcus ethanolidurans]|uniref:Ribosomal RNA small subunit methyltransferase G n=1 Tax=Pediococcus ethanolidurans TaxID=319653 RepID=A0A0R2JWY1_9LACO|nr:16S rRNA (guanine(527)-N(7))-methyltransferase RsmG [Pediococcus ethanolidurans]KRN81657.1 cell division sam-dependent methyltransferase [Pediococcus ethanolidurans]GEN96108.1 ribosomal RNA small subunit methyltransferase G [Pediococcus ethanolidurans]SER85859.1 16S rRNA (guanine527-N7)-methyltransferase [Pediococcus ethanolidurans]